MVSIKRLYHYGVVILDKNRGQKWEWRMIKNFKLLCLISIIFSLLFSNCAGNIYTVRELQENEELYNKHVLKEVKVRKQNDSVLYGLLYDRKKDSTVIRVKKTQELMWLSNEEIKFIVTKHQGNPTLIAAILFVAVIIALSAMGFGDAVSQI